MSEPTTAVGSDAKKRRKGRPNSKAGTVGPDALIAATRSLLKQKRPEQITRVDIAREAGVDPSLVRYYFGETSELMLEAALQAANDLRTSQRSVAEADMNPREKLANRIRTLVETTSREPFMHHLFVDKIVSGDSPKVKSARDGMVRRGRLELQQIIEDGVREGLMRPVDPGILYLAIIGATTFPVAERKLFAALFGKKEFRKKDLDLYADGLIDLLLNGVKGSDA